MRECKSCAVVDACHSEIEFTAIFGAEAPLPAASERAPRLAGASVALIEQARESVRRTRRRLPRDLTDDELAAVAVMDADQYRRFLDARRQRRRREAMTVKASAIPPAIDELQAQKRELGKRLAEWVSANKGHDRFARKFVAREDQRNVVKAWALREYLRAAGEKPTDRKVAELLARGGLALSHQAAGRLLKRVEKLEAPGGPWWEA